MSCKTILPQNIDQKLNVLDVVGCERLKEIKNALEKVKYFNDPLKIDENFLELIADEYESKFWNNILDKEKRKLINSSKFYYRKIGTVWAIKEVLKVLEIDSKLKEWFDYEGEPYHFKVILSPTNKNEKFDDNEFKKIVSLIDSVKNVRSVLDGFEIELILNENINVFAGIVSQIKINQDLEVKKEFKTPLNSFSAGVTNIAINQNLKVENDFKTDNNLQSGVVYNLQLSTTLNYSMEMNNKNNLQGAVIWQV